MLLKARTMQMLSQMEKRDGTGLSSPEAADQVIALHDDDEVVNPNSPSHGAADAIDM